MNHSAEPSRENSETSKRGRDVMSELNRDTDQEILEIFDTESSLHVMDIASTADRHPITVDQTCARLHERGQIHSVGRGVYTITSDGIRQIESGPDS